jgi:hypothetical protein
MDWTTGVRVPALSYLYLPHSDGLWTGRPEFDSRQWHICIFPTATGYELDDRSSIPGSGIFVSSAQQSDRLWGQPSLQRALKASSLGVKLTTSRPLTSMQRSRLMDLHIHYPLRLHGVVFNYFCSETTLPFIFQPSLHWTASTRHQNEHYYWKSV